MKTIATLLLFLVVSCTSHPVAEGPQKPTVILIGLDGFHPDYLTQVEAPTLKSFVTEGVSAKVLNPVFPSLTFPNFYTIATGLLPEKHGIIANDIFDPETKGEFKLSQPEGLDKSEWWGGEPLWVSATKQGVPAATMFWVGSQSEIQGVRPSLWQKFDPKFPKKDRVKQILAWLDLPVERRPHFITYYIEDVDQMGHAHGPGSPEVLEAVKGIDQNLGELVAEIKARGLEPSTDLIVVSDHGMTEIDPARYIDVSPVIAKDNVRVTGKGSVVGFWPGKGKEKAFFKRLAKVSPHQKVYWKKDIPEKFRYRNHRRIPPILAVADEGWMIGVGANPPERGGMHGYDPDLQSMKGIFLAKGPHFKKNVQVPSVENVDIYPLVCHLLSLKPAPHDGKLERVLTLLAEQQSDASLRY